METHQLRERLNQRLDTGDRVERAKEAPYPLADYFMLFGNRIMIRQQEFISAHYSENGPSVVVLIQPRHGNILKTLRVDFDCSAAAEKAIADVQLFTISCGPGKEKEVPIPQTEEECGLKIVFMKEKEEMPETGCPC